MLPRLSASLPKNINPTHGLVYHLNNRRQHISGSRLASKFFNRILHITYNRMELPSTDSPSVVAFIAKVSSELNMTFTKPSSVFSFGSTLDHLIPKMNAFVLSGIKRGMAGFPVPLDITAGDIAVAIDTNYQPAILIRVKSRTAVQFSAVTSKFVFEEGHPEISVEDWRRWHQKFWEKDLDHDGTPFGDGSGRKVLNMIFEVVYPIPKSLTTDSDPVRALLELVKRCTGLKVTPDQIKQVFAFSDGESSATKKLNSKAVKGEKTTRISFPAPKEPQWGVGDYSVGLGQFGEPYLLIQLTWLEERNFDLVDETFALDEGGKDYEGWRTGCIQSWKEKKDHDGSFFGNGMEKTVLCERFQTIWPDIEEDFP